MLRAQLKKQTIGTLTGDRKIEMPIRFDRSIHFGRFQLNACSVKSFSTSILIVDGIVIS